MRHGVGDLSQRLLPPEGPGAKWEYSVLLIIANRMQGESLRYQLVSQGFDVDLARSVSAGLNRVAGAGYDAVVLDWRTLEVEYAGGGRIETWVRLVREARLASKPVGVVALLDAGQSALMGEIEQAGAVGITHVEAVEPPALAEAVARAVRSTGTGKERTEDIPLFIRYFLEKLCRRDGLPPKRLMVSAEAELRSRPWRGNLRELENAVEIAVIRSQDRVELTEHDFPPAPVEQNLDLKARVTRYERDLILRALDLTQGNKNKAAQMLRIKRTTLIEKLKRFES